MNKIILKNELKKFSLSTIIFIIWIFWKDSNHGTIPFLDILDNFINTLFEWPPFIYVLFILFYVIFNLFYFIIWLVFKKILKKKIKILTLATILMSLLIFIPLINMEYAYWNFNGCQSLFGLDFQELYFIKSDHKIKEYKNYRNYIWIKKYRIPSNPTLLGKDILSFQSDTLALISGWTNHLNYFFTIQDLLGLYENKYKLLYSINGDTLILKKGIANFKGNFEEYRLIEIQNDTLFLRSVLIDSTIYFRQIVE